MENSSIKIVNQKDLIADDMWYEIFLHLSLTAIFKFRSVSKVWFSILSSPNFMNQWYKLNNSLLPWGLFQLVRLEIQFSHPDSNSQFISDHQHGFSFRFLLDQLVNQNLIILGSSNGLVLCTTRFYYQKTYYVCNPITRKWVLLPPPPTKIKSVVTGFVCNECFSESTCYKVIRIHKFEAEDKELKVEIFSSDYGEWSVYDVSCPLDATSKFFVTDNLVTYNGVLYWLQKRNSKILAVSVDVNTNHGTSEHKCRLINIPEPVTGDENKYLMHCLGESEGLLCYAKFKAKEKSLCIWVLDGDWYVLHKDIKLNYLFAEIKSKLIDESDNEDWITGIQAVGLNPYDKNVVVLSYKGYVWSYNTKTRVYKQLCHLHFMCGDFLSVPHLEILDRFIFKPWPTILPSVSSE